MTGPKANVSDNRTTEVLESYRNTTTHEDGVELYQDSIADEVPVALTKSTSKELPRRTSTNSRSSRVSGTKSSKRSLNQRLCEAPVEPEDVQN